MREVGGWVDRSTPPPGTDTGRTTCSNTAQDSCLIKDPRSEAMQTSSPYRYPLLGVMAYGRQGGGWTGPPVHPLVT